MFDDDWDLYDKWQGSDWSPEWRDEPPPVPLCNHEWKSILLITSTVYDCKKCGMKKEDYDKQGNLFTFNDDDIPF